ncbi:hypothetical protein [Peribacillus sp. TH24]|uniref:hypothetical protein n=1 Tax=Peribacillus sp. TH24 TaxID=2798483 RepID=UPI001912262A|nr:hypothetical protein [Peribacillus sp. TH24]MBK5446049.1 hypothetical protein [Peribacillus sp. TH24]
MFNKSSSKKQNSDTPIICTTNGATYQKFHPYKESYKRKVLVIKDYGEDRGVTHKSVALFEAVKDQFDRFTEAKIVKEINKDNILVYSDLILKDKNGNELHLSGCSCGYTGTGPHGTEEVLNKAGFDIDRRFIFSAKEFNIFHPIEEESYYGERL